MPTISSALKPGHLAKTCPLCEAVMPSRALFSHIRLGHHKTTPEAQEINRGVKSFEFQGNGHAEKNAGETPTPPKPEILPTPAAPPAPQPPTGQVQVPQKAPAKEMSSTHPTSSATEHGRRESPTLKKDRRTVGPSDRGTRKPKTENRTTDLKTEKPTEAESREPEKQPSFWDSFRQGMMRPLELGTN